MNYIDPSGHFAVSRMLTDERNDLTGKNRPSSQNRIQQALADKRPQIYPEPGLKDEKIREEIEKGTENYIELSYTVELQRQQAEEESRRAFCESLETREGQITAINILLTTLNLTGLALIGLGTGVGWIPFAFAAAGAVSGLITGAFEEAGTLEEKLYNATQGMVDGMLYWETLGVIGIAAPGLVSNPTGAMITEAAMETAVDILYAIKDNVTLAPGSMAWIFLTNIITTGGTSFKQLDEAWSYLKGAKNLDDFKLRAQKLIKGGSKAVPNMGFDDFTSLKKYMGDPGDGNAWHHIVEQSQIGKRANFDANQVHNVNNIIAIPAGADSIHSKISAHYSSKFDFTDGLTVRDWLSTKSFDEQFEYGKELLEEYGEVIATDNGWIFKPY